MNFSVLMSLYCNESITNLENALDSIFIYQSVIPDQLVLVIDGPISSDLNNTVEKWKLKLGEMLEIVPLKENVGLGKALNEGLKHCKYEWVFRMDTDDICAEDRFEKQLKYICENPDIVLFGGQILEFRIKIFDTQILKRVPLTYEEILKFSRYRSPFNHQTVAFQKTIINKVGGYMHHPMMEDYNLWLRIIADGYKVGNMDDMLVHVRVGNGMHAKRRGLIYIKSEKQLLDLKKELKLHDSFNANMLFLVRSTFRLLPARILGKVYNAFLRQKVFK